MIAAPRVPRTRYPGRARSGIAERWFYLRSSIRLHLRLRSPRSSSLTGDSAAASTRRWRQRPSAHGMRIASTPTSARWSATGGPDAIDAAEQLFWIDSDCTLSILETLEATPVRGRWRLTLRGTTVCSMTSACRSPTSSNDEAARDGFGAAIGSTRVPEAAWRQVPRPSAEIATLLDHPSHDPNHPFGLAFRRCTRSRRLQPLADSCARSRRAGLREPLSAIVPATSTCTSNRMSVSAAPARVVLYDLLRRHYDGVIARSKRVDRPLSMRRRTQGPTTGRRRHVMKKESRKLNSSATLHRCRAMSSNALLAVLACLVSL